MACPHWEASHGTRSATTFFATLAIAIFTTIATAADKEEQPFYVLYKLIKQSAGDYLEFKSAALARRAAEDHVATLARDGNYIIIASRAPDPWSHAKASLKAKNIFVADTMPNFDYAKDYVEAFNATSYAIVKAKFRLDLPKPSGKPRYGKQLVYVVDASGTSLNLLPFMIVELWSSISKLSDQQSYMVIFYQGEKLITAQPGAMAAATSDNKTASLRWFEERNVVPGGASDPCAALTAAYAADPDLIFWLNDGLDTGRYEIDQAKLIKHIKALHKKHGTKMNTIQFLNKQGHETIAKCAKITGGLHKYVTARELAIETNQK